jgi:hypothetical protein
MSLEKFGLLRATATFVASVTAIVLFVAWLFPLTLNVYDTYQSQVNKETCTCNCWDGRFKGSYGRGGYKALYFNIDPNMIPILMVN